MLYSDGQGRVRGLQYRLDKPLNGGKSKYLWLSSPPSQYPHGTTSGSPLHFAGRHLLESSSDIWLTEGALKSDVASFLLGAPFIAAAGVTQWGDDFAERFKRKFPGKRAIIAFDQDWRTNAHVKLALERLMARLKSAGVRYIVRTWDGPEKGIDDLALSLPQRDRKRVA